MRFLYFFARACSEALSIKIMSSHFRPCQQEKPSVWFQSNFGLTQRCSDSAALRLLRALDHHVSDGIDTLHVPHDSSHDASLNHRTFTLPPSLNARFGALADERIHDHPIRYFFTLPVLRDVDMLLRPRTLEYDLDVAWWQWSDHPAQSAWAILLGLINLFYVAAAAWAFLRGRVPLAWMLGAYLILRFMILGTLEAPEPRYTIECFPIFIIAAAAVLSGSKLAQPRAPVAPS